MPDLDLDNRGAGRIRGSAAEINPHRRSDPLDLTKTLLTQGGAPKSSPDTNTELTVDEDTGAVVEKTRCSMRRTLRKVLRESNQDNDPVSTHEIELRLRTLDKETLVKLVEATGKGTDTEAIRQQQELLAGVQCGSGFELLAKKLQEDIEEGSIQDNMEVAKALCEDSSIDQELQEELLTVVYTAEKIIEAVTIELNHDSSSRNHSPSIHYGTAEFVTAEDHTLEQQEQIDISGFLTKATVKEAVSSLMEMLEAIMQEDDRKDEIEDAIKKADARKFNIDQRISEILAQKSELAQGELLSLMLEQSRLQEGIRIMENELRAC